tara:strand:+ start:1235 stop:1513 length:279 start_codon:yes stop_codon:yes gene_type:complete
MPYIPNEEETAQRAEWKAEREAKDKKLNAGFDKLTPKQQDAMKYVYSIIEMYNEETREMDGDFYKSTDTALKSLHMKLYKAFPNLRGDDDDD